MPKIFINNKSYIVDEDGFLIDFNQWDNAFAESLAPELSIPGGLTVKHWEVIHYIRDWYIQKGVCPLVYHTCKMNQLRINQLKKLFPTGYLRGACKLAGISYKYTFYGNPDKPQLLPYDPDVFLTFKYSYSENVGKPSVLPEKQKNDALPKEQKEKPALSEKYYTVDLFGFLVDPDSWDEQFAIHKAFELKQPEVLTEKHWLIIYFLRNRFTKNGAIPTVYDTCSHFQMEIDELAHLFPDGYHRGAVKIAGLRV
jgi:tRNA 2-thiouridine synthesizing protein E